MKEWIKSEFRCPRCGETTEILVDDVYEYAERCKKCGWHHNFRRD